MKGFRPPYRKKNPPTSTSTEFKLTFEYKENVRKSSYIGKKGYTIPKTVITQEDEDDLRKELYVKPKGILSLQKHFHRSEHWVVTQGTPKITLNKKKFVLKTNETIFIPVRSIHRIENPYKKPVKIIEAQLGSILKETDIIRYHDAYGRIK